MKDKIIINARCPIPEGYKTLKIDGNIRYLEEVEE